MYTVEDLRLALNKESFDNEQLELLCLIANGYTDEDIAKKKSISLNAFRKRMGNIYLKIGVEGVGRGKLTELNKKLKTRLEANSKKRKILITYFSEDEERLAVDLSKMISPSPDSDFLIIRSSISSGQRWKEEIEDCLTEVETGIACFLYDNLETPMANAAIGFLDGRLKNFRFIYFGSTNLPNHLRLFNGLEGTNVDNLVSLQCVLKGELSVDKDNWIRHQYTELNWRNKVIKNIEAKNNRSNAQSEKRLEIKKIVESKTSLEDILQLLDDETFQYEHKIIKEMAKRSLPQLSDWLPDISGPLIQDMKNLKEEIREELLIQGFPVIPADLQKKEPEVISEKITNTIGEIKDFPIKVCVLRVMQEGKSLKQKSFCLAKGVSPIYRDIGDRPPGIGFVQIAVTTKKPISVRHIDEQLTNSFVNSTWIRKNHLRSFHSFPVIRGTEVEGTLSIYGDCEYAIFEHPKHFYFMNCLVRLIAQIIVKLNKMKAIKTLLLLNRDQPELFISHNSFSDTLEKVDELKQSFFIYG